LRGPTSNGRERKGWGSEGREGMKRERMEGKGEKGKGRVPPQRN